MLERQQSGRSLRDALDELIQRKVGQSNGVDTEWTTVTVRDLRVLLATHPDKLSPGAFFATEPAEWYGEYGVRYTSGPRKGSMPRRFRDLAEAVEFVTGGTEEMVVLHRVVGKWTEVEL